MSPEFRYGEPWRLSNVRLTGTRTLQFEFVHSGLLGYFTAC